MGTKTFYFNYGVSEALSDCHWYCLREENGNVIKTTENPDYQINKQAVLRIQSWHVFTDKEKEKIIQNLAKIGWVEGEESKSNPGYIPVEPDVV